MRTHENSAPHEVAALYELLVVDSPGRGGEPVWRADVEVPRLMQPKAGDGPGRAGPSPA